jgi:large subunit ribosomal protein L35
LTAADLQGRRPAISLLGTVTRMPKMKSHKSIRKRFRATASGKLKRRQSGKKHLLSPKTGKRKRQLRSPITETTKIAKTYVRLMG